MPSTISGDANVSATEFGYLDGVTSALQTQIDAKLTTPGAWTSYTPTLTGSTLGNGSIAGTYVQIGKTVHFYAKFTLGSTSAITGSPSISLPVTCKTGINTGVFANIVDNGSIYITPAHAILAGTVATIRALNAAGTYISVVDMSSTIPFTWASSDWIEVAGTYEAA